MSQPDHLFSEALLTREILGIMTPGRKVKAMGSDGEAPRKSFLTTLLLRIEIDSLYAKGCVI